MNEALHCCFLLLEAEEQTERAFSLGIAALIGEGIFNFGELVSQQT